MDSPIRKTLRVLYSGRVQGVGFRYTVREIVRHNPIDGYVMNLPDGQVELVAQGTVVEIESLLKAIGERFRANIRGTDRQEVSTDETFAGFKIRH